MKDEDKRDRYTASPKMTGVAAGPPPVSLADETYSSGALPAAAAHAVNTPRSVRACQLCGVTPAELAATADDPPLPDRLRSALLRQARLNHRMLLARARPRTARDGARQAESGGGGGGDAASCLSGGSGGSAAAARRRLEKRRRCELGRLVARGLASRECEAALAARAGRARVRREAGRRAAAARRRERRAARCGEQQRRRAELLARREDEGREAAAAAVAAAAAATSSPRGRGKRRKEASRRKKRPVSPSPSPPPPPPPPPRKPAHPPQQRRRRSPAGAVLRAASSAAELRRRLEKGAAFELREARRAGEVEAAACAGRARSAAARARSAQQERAGQLLARHQHRARVAGVLEALRRGCPAEAVAAAVPGIVMPEPPAEARPSGARPRGRQGAEGDGGEEGVGRRPQRAGDLRAAMADEEGGREETVEEVLRRVGLLSPEGGGGGGGGGGGKGGVGVVEGAAEQLRYYSQWMYD